MTIYRRTYIKDKTWKGRHGWSDFINVSGIHQNSVNLILSFETSLGEIGLGGELIHSK